MSDRIVAASWIGTAWFTVTAVLATAFSGLRIVGVISALALFGLGVVALLAAFARGVQRSRAEEVTVPGLFFLVGSTPKPTRVLLLGSLAVQVVVAFTTASLRPFTAVAFGILAPMYGLGLAGLWAALHGTFPPRQTKRSTGPTT